MKAASKSTLRLNNLKILRPKVKKILQICIRSFVNPHPVELCSLFWCTKCKILAYFKRKEIFELWIILKNEFCLENATMFQIQDMFENWKPNIVEIPKTQCFNLCPFLTLSIRNGPSVSFGIFELSSCRNFKFNRFYYKAGLFTSTLSIHRNRKAFKLIRFYSCFQICEPSLFKDVQWEWWTTCKDWRHVLALR